MDFKRQALADTAQRGVIGHGFGGARPRNSRKDRESLQRQQMPRSESMPSK